MSNSRVWLFRGLVVVAIGLMLVTWFQRWWNLDIYEIDKGWMRIYPYGLRHNIPAEYYTLSGGAADLPAWFTPLAFVFLAACIVGLLLSMWLTRRREGKWLLGAVGVAYFFVPVVMAIVATIKLAPVDIPLQGRAFYSLGGYFESQVCSRLEWAWYAAFGVGLFCIVLALLRDNIIGKPELDVQGNA
jgi:hypothetical protein